MSVTRKEIEAMIKAAMSGQQELPGVEEDQHEVKPKRQRTVFKVNANARECFDDGLRALGVYNSSLASTRFVESALIFMGEWMKSEAEKIGNKIPVPDSLCDTGDLYADAVRFVRTRRTCSQKMLANQFSIGTEKTKQIIQRMEREGIVGPQKHSRARDVLVPRASFSSWKK